MPRIDNRSGFTLMELVVSIAILALIALMLSRIFSDSVRAVEQGKNLTLLDESARLILDYIETDISQALIRTNVPFRVQSPRGSGSSDSLYFISTGVRRGLEDIPRDTAPMRIQTEQGGESPLNLYVETVSPADISGGNLKEFSNYYFTKTVRSLLDFGNADSATGRREYTRPVDEALANHAVLASMVFTVNANPDWGNGRAADGPPDAADMPRFVDVTIGLVSAGEMKEAIQRNDQQHIENNERLFTRRIHMRNQGVEALPY